LTTKSTSENAIDLPTTVNRRWRGRRHRGGPSASQRAMAVTRKRRDVRVTTDDVTDPGSLAELAGNQHAIAAPRLVGARAGVSPPATVTADDAKRRARCRAVRCSCCLDVARRRPVRTQHAGSSITRFDRARSPVEAMSHERRDSLEGCNRSRIWEMLRRFTPTENWRDRRFL